MDERINYGKVAPEGIRALSGLEAYVRSSGFEPGLLDLVKTRASQLNGCAYCIDMHTKDARASGETEQRLYGLSAWRETPFYTDRERAALAWTEAVTLVSDGPVPDALYQEARRHFSEKELVAVTSQPAAVPQRGRWTFPVLVDDGAHIHRNVGATDAAGRPAPAVFVTDRFREIFAAYLPGHGAALPGAKEILDWLVFINIQCPECGVPEWPR